MNNTNITIAKLKGYTVHLRTVQYYKDHPETIYRCKEMPSERQWKKWSSRPRWFNLPKWHNTIELAMKLWIELPLSWRIDYVVDVFVYSGTEEVLCKHICDVWISYRQRKGGVKDGSEEHKPANTNI